MRIFIWKKTNLPKILILKSIYFILSRDFKSPSQLGIVTKKQFNNEPVRLSNARSSDALKIHQSSGGEILKPNTQSYYVPEKDTSNIKEH